MRPYLVFPCPKCRNFTNAPVGQKRRRCSFCGHIIDISKAACALFDTPEQASLAVKEFNAARGGDEFHKAVERSRERIRSFVPSERVSSKDLVDRTRSEPSSGKRKRLMQLLEREASETDCTLGHLEELCEEYQLDWTWVEEQLTKLANQGVVIFPRPWTVRLVQASRGGQPDKKETQDVSKEIVEELKRRGGQARVKDIMKFFSDKGVLATSVETSLEKLMRADIIYQPSPTEVKLL